MLCIGTIPWNMSSAIILAMNTAKATACVLGAGALWGCISIFVRQLSAAGLSTMDTVCVRMVIGAVGMLIVILIVDRSLLRIRLRDIWLFIGTGIVSITMFSLCYFTCITISEASIAVVLLYTSPIFVMIMSAVFFKEKLTKRKAAALVMTFVGCVLVAGLLGGSVRMTPLALLVGVASGFFYATYSIFGRIALKRYDTLTITFYTFVLSMIACLVVGNPGAIISVTTANPPIIGYYLGLGVLCTIAPYLLYTAGLKYLETSRAAIFATIEPVVGSLLGIFAYGESVGAQKLVGMLLVVAAVVLASLKEAECNG